MAGGPGNILFLFVLQQYSIKLALDADWQANVHPYQFARLSAGIPLGTGFHGDLQLIIVSP